MDKMVWYVSFGVGNPLGNVLLKCHGLHREIVEMMNRAGLRWCELYPESEVPRLVKSYGYTVVESRVTPETFGG